MKIREYKAILDEEGKTFIPATYSVKEWLAFYNEHASELDTYFLNLYADMSLQYAYTSESASFITSLLLGVLYSNDYKYDNLYKTIIQEYNPIDNYDKKEEITTTYGAMSKENNVSSVTSLSTVGLAKQTTVIGAKNETVTSSTTTYDSDAFADKDKNIATSDPVTSSSTSDARTDTTTVNPYNTSEKSAEHIDKVVNHTSGNIGVTTTAQMLQGERDLSMFSFYGIIYGDLIRAICKLYYEDEE